MNTTQTRDDPAVPVGVAPGDSLTSLSRHRALADLDSEFDGFELLAVIRSGWRVILAFLVVFLLAIGTYVALADDWYRAEVLLSPTQANAGASLAGRLAQLGGLAGLVGVTATDDSSAEAIAVLQSRDFAQSFIQEHALLPVFFADEWDAEKHKWRSPDAAEQPDIRDGVKYFEDHIRHVQQNRDTGLVTLAIEWKDPEVAADWANALVEKLNDRMRQQALTEAQTNVDYLRSELATTTVLTLQQSISRLLESELQKLMIARGNKEFSFRIIDRGKPPKDPSNPKKLLLLILAVFSGLFFGSFFVLARQAFRNAQKRRVMVTRNAPGTSVL